MGVKKKKKKKKSLGLSPTSFAIIFPFLVCKKPKASSVGAKTAAALFCSWSTERSACRRDMLSHVGANAEHHLQHPFVSLLRHRGCSKKCKNHKNNHDSNPFFFLCLSHPFFSRFHVSCSETSLLIIRVPSPSVLTYLSPYFICFQLPHWIKARGGIKSGTGRFKSVVRAL